MRRPRDLNLAESPATEGFLLLCFFVLVSLFLTFPLVLHLKDSLPGHLADPLDSAWVINWNLHALSQDVRTIYQANVFYPLPNSLAYGEPVFGASLLALPVFAFTHNALIIYNIAFLTTFVLCGFCGYLFVHQITGGRLGAILAGLSFAYCPYRAFHMGHLNLLGNQFLPLLFLFVYRYISQGQRKLDITGAAVSYFLLALYSGYYVLYTIPIAISFIAPLVIARRNAIGWRRAGIHGGIAALAVGVVVLLIYLPCLTIRDNGKALGRAFTDQLVYSAEPKDYLSVPDQCRNLIHMGFRRNRNGERALFPGILPVVGLVILASWGSARSRIPAGVTKALVFCMVAAFLFSLGPLLDPDHKESLKLPYYLLFRWIPGGGRLRVVARFGMYFGAAMAFLAGIAFHLVFSRIGRKMIRRPLFLGVLSFFAYEASIFPFQFSHVPGAQNGPGTYQKIAELPAETALIELPMLEPPYRDGIYEYYSTFHWRRLVNGARSSPYPSRQVELRRLMKGFPSAASIAWLEAARVEYAHINLGLWRSEKYPPIDPLLQPWSKDLTVVEQSPDAILIRLHPHDVPEPDD